MKVSYSHYKMDMPGGGWMEYDIKHIKEHWWSRWKTVMETPHCPMFFNISHFRADGTRI